VTANNRIFLAESENNTITESTINNLGMAMSNNNIVAKNDVLYKLYVEGYNNKIFQNNFFLEHSNVQPIGFDNFLDYGSVGNYWSSYNGTDSDGDGIGDTPLIINSTLPGDGAFTDNYPLMEPADITTGYVPEFPSWMVFPVIVFVTLVALLSKKRLTNH
jgi:hypothetical protein